jgi:hypothetical protein
MSTEKRRRYEAWNELCDADALWGPLLFLRPSQDAQFTSLRLLAVVVPFSAFYGMLTDLGLHYLQRLFGGTLPQLFLVPLGLMVTAFVCGELTFLRAWNERARLMSRRESWLERQGGASSRGSSSLGDQPGE